MPVTKTVLQAVAGGVVVVGVAAGCATGGPPDTSACCIRIETCCCRSPSSKTSVWRSAWPADLIKRSRRCCWRRWASPNAGEELARAGLAVALANDPVVVLADEPTGELDTATEADVLAILGARAEAGAADRVIALADGQVLP